MEVLCVVLLFVLSALAGGCRNGEPGPSPSLPFSLRFTPGAQFVYDTLTLDQRYPRLPPAKTTTSWRVLTTQAEYQGKGEVTVIVDSANSASAGTDTLYLATSPSGDISIYGFLARIVKRRLGKEIDRRWDLVASFSAGETGLWTVGPADSLGREIIYGNIAGASDYYSATVDGVTEAFPTYRVDLTGPSLYCSLWFSNAPNAIVRLLEEPGIEVNGQLRELVAIETGTR
ncbi:hypothetical protein EHM92_05865 [bacterium]|nr:MAG: hypothetical protein EHM92_05865 [bacterium]